VTRTVFSLLVFVFLTAICSTAPLLAQTGPLPPAFIPIEEWLNGPGRQDFPWKVRVVGPTLTLQQRQFVEVQVAIRQRDLFKDVSKRDLHFIIKVADEKGSWLAGQSYSHFIAPPDFSRGDVLRPITTLYLHPGNYTIAVVAYDAANNRGNVWRGRLLVPPLGDPLHNLDNNFPAVEFLPALDRAAFSLLGGNGTWELSQPAALAHLLTDALALGHGSAELPIKNRRPVLIDVVLNLSSRPASSYAYKQSEGALLQVGNLLSQISLEKGCVRVTAMDIFRQEAIVDRAEADSLNWDDIVRKVAALELNIINVSALSDRDSAVWFEQSLERALASGGCGLDNSSLRHVLVIVGRPFLFRPGAFLEPMARRAPNPRCYYLRYGFKGESWTEDQIESLIEPLNPIRLEYPSPLELRKKLAFMITDIEGAD
jgi:hypothetical protein